MVRKHIRHEDKCPPCKTNLAALQQALLENQLLKNAIEASRQREQLTKSLENEVQDGLRKEVADLRELLQQEYNERRHAKRKHKSKIQCLQDEVAQLQDQLAVFELIKAVAVNAQPNA